MPATNGTVLVFHGRQGRPDKRGKIKADGEWFDLVWKEYGNAKTKLIELSAKISDSLD
ncbi:MAG: hypothetical protein MUC43_14975 [Pirellula sp.]|nr:hypothetical protein [Pirellula sp.]